MTLRGSLPQINLGVQGRALDWFELLGYKVVEDKVTDYAHLKEDLSEQFPVVRNRSELETRFFASSQKHNQKPSDFLYDLLNIQKILKLELTEEKLIEHIISRLELQILDNVEVKHPQTTSNILQIIDKNWQENWRETRGNNRYLKNSRRRREFNRFESQGVADNRRFDGRRRGGQSDHRFHIKGVDKVVQRAVLSGVTLWDTGVEKSFISEEVYRKYFSYRSREKTKDRVVTAQGAPCCHLDRVELQIRIREFQKTWEFHILHNMQYQCILGIDFMKESKLTLDFDQKSLIIPDNQIQQSPKTEKLFEIDLSDTKLGEGQNQKLRNLFNGFKGLFSDQSGLTYVLYHEIDTGDKGLVVSRPYRYDRVKQGIIDYHIVKMLRESTICPIQSPYASPVVLTRKTNDLPPYSPESYRFAIDYRKLNAITK
ncbi:uncharacterized protein TNCV_1683011 [Trichonephila clavipes]|nr:uncharacterized protein TNCV_1683011 [Trichonephila clavipes]